MNRIAKISTVIILLTLLFACKKNLTDLNVNPNDPLTTDPNYLFSYALQQGAGNYNSDVNLEQWGLMNWVMYMAARGGVEPGKEYIIPGGKDAFWTEQYSNALSNLQVIIDMADDDDLARSYPGIVNMKSAAIIWKVNLFHKITDLWGDVPYSDALQGITSSNFTPVYDPQVSIYHDMIASLNIAVNSFDNELPFFEPASDLIYQGNMDHWIAFANSLKLRLATRINKVDYATYQSVLEELHDQPLIASNQENAIFPFNSAHKNHLYETMFRGESTVQNNPSKFFVDMIVNTNDPRVKIFFEKGLLASLPFIPDYNGVPNLLTNNSPEWENYNLNEELGIEGEWGDISKIGTWFLNNNTPGVIFSYAEVCFLLAEAALQGVWTGNPDELLRCGVRANMDFYNLYLDQEEQIPETEINTYLDMLPAADMSNVITQKWITFAYENGYEAYAEYRRTGYPELTDYYSEAINLQIFPYRLTYPYFEYTLNRDNYNAALDQQGPDSEFTKIWWNQY